MNPVTELLFSFCHLLLVVTVTGLQEIQATIQAELLWTTSPKWLCLCLCRAFEDELKAMFDAMDDNHDGSLGPGLSSRPIDTGSGSSLRITLQRPGGVGGSEWGFPFTKGR